MGNLLFFTKNRSVFVGVWLLMMEKKRGIMMLFQAVPGWKSFPVPPAQKDVLLLSQQVGKDHHLASPGRSRI